MSKYRKKIIAGNWKMNKLVSESVSLADGIKRELAECRDVDIVLCPTFIALKAVSDVVDNTSIRLGAQNMHWEISGAYTGEISPTMLRDVFCQYVILGHSERRGYFNETDDNVNKKAKVAIESRMTPIVCVGETLDERDAGDAERIVRKQVELSLADMGEGLSKVVVAYEPVWAIGTGRTATPEQAQDMHAFIRKVIAEMGGQEVSETIRIQYGGSMKPENAKELLAQPDIDGGLIGGAALEARQFVKIVTAAIPE